MTVLTREQYDEITEGREPQFTDNEVTISMSQKDTSAEKEAFYASLAEGKDVIAEAIDRMAGLCFAASHLGGWWTNPETGHPKQRNKGEMIALMHSELSEALEGVRKGTQDDHLPEYDSVTVELADTIIRILDFAGGFGLPVGQALVDKMLYNGQRADHKPENRVKEGGKDF